ncbi:XRE family transcriptional regulator [Vibrio sp. UCD-FRSSP16_10]|uniref:LysR substrate-binding domain-containing protein n=1 Tax=unclassified Vibrio TaxID=2614977 RepID=UPI0007FD0A07|nr:MULTISPECIES: LysR substrate-binding domain-containing protein [unclassified Vibrio]OBT06572.1 XRE family transcriptional regulator [Vibrio sp. UCD-FRSSP16_30]OBT12269.1 XRE family transcriptional regulator [Vibrio sp. UCD-FRSSP16_10]
MIPFTLRQLEVFTCVAKANSLSSAAKSLYLSKAAVSLSLNQLENQLAHTLFDRVNNRLILNQEGMRLLSVADEVLERARAIPNLFTQSSPEKLSGTLNIGASNTIGNQLLPYLIRDFTAQYPDVKFKTLLENSAVLSQKVIDYQVDIAFIESNQQLDKLTHHPFGFDQMCVICNPDDPLAHRSQVSINDLEERSWLVRELGSGSRDYFMQHIAKHTTSWQEEFVLSSSEAIINSVSAGLGLACLSELSIDSALKAGKISKLNINLPLDRSMQVVLHKDKYLNPLLSAFLHYSLEWRLSDHPTK